MSFFPSPTPSLGGHVGGSGFTIPQNAEALPADHPFSPLTLSSPCQVPVKLKGRGSLRVRASLAWDKGDASLRATPHPCPICHNFKIVTKRSLRSWRIYFCFLRMRQDAQRGGRRARVFSPSGFAKSSPSGENSAATCPPEQGSPLNPLIGDLKRRARFGELFRWQKPRLSKSKCPKKEERRGSCPIWQSQLL